MNFTKLLDSGMTSEWVRQRIAELAPYPYLADVLVILSSFLIGAALALVAYFILRRMLLRFYRRYCELSVALLHCIRNMCFALASCLPIYAVAYCAWVDGIHEWVALVMRALMSGLLVLAVAVALVNGILSFGLWYKQQPNAAQRPVDGLLRTAVVFVWTGAFILFFSVIFGKSPIYLLSGLGAMAAVLMLVFQPTILSLVASVRVNTNRLVEIGDWIVMADNGVDGMVEEISLHTLKVRNWDRTLVCMPITDLVDKSFVNYSAMQKLGGRRIKKAYLIDQRSVRFLSREEVRNLKGFDLLKNYLSGKEEEFSQYNTGRSRYNTRHLTNIGTFRAYAKHYLERHPSIRQDMPLMVRVRAPTSTGVPVEIYCFAKEVDWIPFERVQSDVIEHLLAILPSFRLRVFQECSDIYQEIGDQIDVVGGAFRFDQLVNPVYPDNGGIGSGKVG